MRTTAELVAGIIEVDTKIDLTPFLVTASSLVDQIAERADPSLPGERLELIERYLAAHFYTLRDPRVTSERAGSVGASYQSAVALGLNTSHYGQTAMLLDTSGILSIMNKGNRRATIHWVGQECDVVVP